MSSFNNLRANARSSVAKLQDLTTTDGQMQEEPLYDLNECSDDKVAAFVREQCSAQPEKLHLKLPSSLLKLDLSYCTSIRDSDVVQVMKQCPQLTSLVFNGNDLITNKLLAHIFRLQHLDRLRLANLRQITSVTREARAISLEEGRASPLRSLELENCPLDDSWMEALALLPNLEHFKSIEVCDPKDGFLATSMPANLRSVEITLSQKARCESKQRELFFFFLHNPSAESLQRFVYNPSRTIAVDSKPALFVAVNLRTLETNAKVIMSRDFLQTLSVACPHLNTFEDPSGPGGKGLLGHWELEKNKLLVNVDYTDGYYFRSPPSDDIWKTNPKTVNARSMHPNQSIGLPLQQVSSVETLSLTNLVIQDIGLLLSQLPNLKSLTLNQITIRNTGLSLETSFALLRLEKLHLESRVSLNTIWSISSQASNLKKVVLAPALVKEFQKPNTVWISVLMEAFPLVEKLTLTTLASSHSPNKQFKVELGVLNADTARNFPMKFLLFRKTKTRREFYTPEDPYLDCEFNFDSKTNFELLPNLLYLEMNNVRINEDIVLGGPNMKLLWIEGQLALGRAARLGFPSRILRLGWRVMTNGSDICKLLPSLKYLKDIHILPQAASQWKTSLPLSSETVRRRTREARKLDEISCQMYAQHLAMPSKPLIDPHYRNHSYSESDINNLREMFSIQKLSTSFTEDIVSLQLKLVNGPSLVIHCNPSHRVMDLYGYVRHETKMDIGFDLVKVPDMILDAKTLGKTIGELQLQDSTLNQVLRKYDSVEYQLKLVSIFRSVPTMPKTSGKLMDTNNSNMNIASITHDYHPATKMVTSAKRKNETDVAQSDPRQTKKTKCGNKVSSVSYPIVNSTPNSVYFTGQNQYYAAFIERRVQNQKNSL